jgi:hypothetical protein
LPKVPCSKADDTCVASLVAAHDCTPYHAIVEPLPDDNNSCDHTVWRPGDAPALRAGDRLMTAFLATDSVTGWPAWSVLGVEPSPLYSRNVNWCRRSQDIGWPHVRQTKPVQATDLRMVYLGHDTRRGRTT